MGKDIKGSMRKIVGLGKLDIRFKWFNYYTRDMIE